MSTNVVTEVHEDGTSNVIQTSGGSNYEMELERLTGDVPQLPEGSLKRLYKPRYVMRVKLDDETSIPFVYKRIDPATLILTHGSPIAVNTDIAATADDLSSRLNSLVGEDQKVTEDNAAELREILSDPRSREVVETAGTLRKNVIQTGVIQPEITDEVFENLDDDILDALYEAITGGITSQNELVEHFRK